jgi:hypothetical protein
MKDYKLDRLSELPLFFHLDHHGMRRLAAIADEVTVKKGTTLTAETDRTTDFFVIEEGRAIRQVDGRQAVEMVTGDFFGELPAPHVHWTPARETIEAASDLRMLIIRREAFPLLNELVPGLTGTLAEAVALHSGF